MIANLRISHRADNIGAELITNELLILAIGPIGLDLTIAEAVDIVDALAEALAEAAEMTAAGAK